MVSLTQIQKTLQRIAVPGSLLREKNLPKKLPSLKEILAFQTASQALENSFCFNPQDRYQVVTSGFHFDRSRVICKSCTLKEYEN